MKRILLILSVLIIWSLNAKIEILQQTAEIVVIKLKIDQYNIIETNEFTELSFPEWGYSQNTGAPNLPEKRMSVGVPPEGVIEIKVISSDVIFKTISKPVSPVPNIIESGKTFEYIYNINQQKYTATSDDFISKGERFTFRRFSAVPLIFFPVVYHSERNELEICEEIVLEIRILGNTEMRDFQPDKTENFYQGY